MRSITVIKIVICSYLIGLTISHGYLFNRVKYHKNHIITTGKLQQQLLDKGYDIGPKGVDHIWGPNSNDAWIAAQNDQSAAPHFEKELGK